MYHPTVCIVSNRATYLLKVWYGEYDVLKPTCNWATRRINIIKAGMKRSPVRIPALPNGNQDQKTRACLVLYSAQRANELTGIPFSYKNCLCIAKPNQGDCCQSKSSMQGWRQKVLIRTDSRRGRHLKKIRNLYITNLIEKRVFERVLKGGAPCVRVGRELARL